MELTTEPRSAALPDSWSVELLRDCCSRLTVGFVGTCEPFYTTESKGVLLVRTGNLRGDALVLDDAKYVTAEFHAANKKSTIRKGDILIARHGNSGNAVRVPDEVDNVNALNVVIIRTDESRLSGHFAAYSINSGWVKGQAAGRAAGSTQVVINTGEIAKLLIPLPPLSEQRAIAAALGDVDALLGALDRLIAKKRDLKQAAMQQLLTGQTRLPGFSGKWETTALTDLVVRSTGYWGSDAPSGARSLLAKVIRAGDISTDGQLVSAAERYFSEAEFERARCDADDVVITASGNGLGKLWLCNGGLNLAASNFVRVLRPRPERASGRFLAYALKTVEGERRLAEHTATSAYPNLMPSYFSSCWIPTPPIEEQLGIAEVFLDMDAELTALTARRDKTRLLKQGMMQELLTGRTRLV